MVRPKKVKVDGFALEDLVKKLRPFAVEPWLMGYFTAEEVLALYEYGAGLPISWNIETSRKLLEHDPTRKVIFWFNPSKQIQREYDEYKDRER